MRARPLLRVRAETRVCADRRDGVTDWFEAGAYVPIYSYTNTGQLLFEGVKLRMLFVVPDAADRKFFYGVNFEYSYNMPTWDTHRFSGEIRPIIGTHQGPDGHHGHQADARAELLSWSAALPDERGIRRR
jgi:hypothetical protein